MAIVKTAISLDASLFEEAECAAREMQMSRSRLYALALRDYLRRRENRRIIEELNEVYAEEPTEEDKAYLRGMRKLYAKTLEPEEW
jgi:metal-responsive CopG/Arc/MetJ family transcriptional regulator